MRNPGTWLSLATSLSLLACATDGSATMMDPDDDPIEEPVPPTVLAKVEGMVVDRGGLPLAGKLVFVGGASVTSDAAGHFAFVDVVAPYNVIITEVGSSMATSIVGLTTATPKVTYTYWPASREATVAGSLITPTQVGDPMFFGVTTKFSSETFDIYAPSFNSKYARWSGPTKTTANLLALKYTSENNKPISYEAIGTATVEVEAGTIKSGITLPSNDPGEVTVTGQLTSPAGSTWSSVRAYAAAGGASVEVARVDAAVLPSFSALLPTGAGITAGFTAWSSTPEGTSMRFVHNVATDVQGLQLTVPAPPHLVAPAPGTTVKPGDVIEWADASAKLFVVEVGQYDSGTHKYPWYSRTLTAEHSLTIPDLSSFGVHWTADRSTHVWIYAYDLPWTIDQAAGESFDNLIDIVASSSGMTTIDGSLAYFYDGYTFLSGN